MRKDVEIHINTGDIVLSPANNPDIRPFNWVENAGGDSGYMYGEISVPNKVGEAAIRKNGLHAVIPYTPVYKCFFISVKRVGEGGVATGYVQNPTNNSKWFLVKAEKSNGVLENVFASELITISEDCFYFKFSQGVAEICCGYDVDLNVVNSNRQNANLLLQCVPTNNYRYPLAGVGLIRYVKSNINRTDLSDVLKREFEDDGVRVVDASYDFDTGDLYLDLDTSNIDTEEHAEA